MADEPNPMTEAEAHLHRRIRELRERARAERSASTPGQAAPGPPSAPPPADLRTILARAEAHVDELRSTAASLSQSLPAQVEAAIERALDEHSTGKRLAELRSLLRGLAGQVEQVNRDLLSERLGRIEDLELLVDLISTGVSAMRQDVANLAADVGRVAGGVEDVHTRLDQPVQVTVERGRQTGVRDLFKPTESPLDASVAGAATSPGEA
ncbi:MAG TPA: hypothetical protein VMU66_07975 [Gaiellales bacterium]|nr:hypothetical protein [Gaiellales bacterium]